MDSNIEKENRFGQIKTDIQGILTQETFLRENCKDLEFTNGTMEEHTKVKKMFKLFAEVNGLKAKCMAKEFLSGKMVENIKESISTISNRAKEYLLGPKISKSRMN
jgi:hypothetical protein